MKKGLLDLIKKYICFFTAVLVLTYTSAFFAVPSFADDVSDSTDEEQVSSSIPPEIEHAKSACLYNFENDRMLFEYNPGEMVYPASSVKLMTAIVAFEAFESVDEKITVTQTMLDEVSGNKIGFLPGESVTVRQMLSCMLVNSANDAAIILAHAAAGSTKDFVNLMNDKAAALGAFNTYYTNPTGMHNDAMVTTVRDTATIAKYAYSIPELVEMTSNPKYVMEETNMSDFRNIYNRNCLVSNYYSLDYYYKYAIGLNAGATSQGGYSIAAVAENAEEGLTYLAVVLGAEENDGLFYNYVNAINLFDWAFKAYGYAKVLSHDKMVCEIPVKLSATLDYVTLVPEEDITVYLPTDIDLEKEIRYSYNTYYDFIDAPVESGQAAGTITVLYGDEILGSCSLVATSSITRSEFLFFLSRVSEFTKGRLFRGTAVSVIVLSVLYAVATAVAREKKLRRSYTRSQYR